MYRERNYFLSEVIDTHPTDPRLAPQIETPRGADTRFALLYYSLYGRRWINAPDATVYYSPMLITRKLGFAALSDVKKLSERDRYTRLVSEQLSIFGVPRHEQQAVVEKICALIDAIVPGSHIVMLLGKVTVQLLDSTARNLDVEDVTLRSRTLWINGKFIRNKKYTDDQPIMHEWELEKLRLDSLEAAVRHMPCVICMDKLDHFDPAEDEEEGNDQQRIVARLPCTHIYHEGCIVQWLETHQKCPLCGYRAVKAAKVRLHWPMLMVSVVGMLAATLVPRMFNRSKQKDENITI